MAGEEVVKQGYELTQKKCENYGKQLSKLSVETFFSVFIVRSAKRYDDLALLAVSARPISRVRILPE